MKFLKPWLGNDVFRCLVCGRFAIAEEKDSHECRILKEYKVEGNIVKGFDGHSWYPLKWDQVRPTNFDREKFRRRLDRIQNRILLPLWDTQKCVTRRDMRST